MKSEFTKVLLGCATAGGAAAGRAKRPGGRYNPGGRYGAGRRNGVGEFTAGAGKFDTDPFKFAPVLLAELGGKVCWVKLEAIIDERLDPDARLPLIVVGMKSEGRKRGWPPTEETGGIVVTLVGVVV